MDKNRLRVVAVHVQLEAFADDGDGLTPLQLQPIRVPFQQWQEFVDSGFASAVDQLRGQVEVEVVDVADVVASEAKPVHNGRVTKPRTRKVTRKVEE